MNTSKWSLIKRRGKLLFGTVAQRNSQSEALELLLLKVTWTSVFIQRQTNLLISVLDVVTAVAVSCFYSFWFDDSVRKFWVFRTCKRNSGLLLDLPNPPFNTVTPSVNARADSRAILAVRRTQTKESPSENVWSKSHPPSTHRQQQQPPQGLLLNPSTSPPPSQPLHPTPPTIHPLQPLHTLREPWSLSAITSFSVA